MKNAETAFFRSPFRHRLQFPAHIFLKLQFLLRHREFFSASFITGCGFFLRFDRFIDSADRERRKKFRACRVFKAEASYGKTSETRKVRGASARLPDIARYASDVCAF